MSEYDVVIIGAGLTGCATAAALAEADPTRQRKILLLDKCLGVHPQFSGELIHPRGAQILDDLGFYEPLSAAGGVDVDGFVVFENADARHVELDYASVENERPCGLSVHHKTLVRTMRRELVRRGPSPEGGPSQERGRGGVELREGWSLLDLRRDERGGIAGVVVQDPNKQPYTIDCDLLVAADGKSSSVRRLAGIGDEGRQTIGFTAGIEVPAAKLPRPTYAQVLLGAWGPVLAYPIERCEDGTLTARVTFDLPKDLPAKGVRLKEYLLRAYVPFIPAPLSGQIAASILGYRGTLEMAPTVNLPAPTATLPGLALVGDAGGCSHPITASGMTMGLRDAETLGFEARRRMNVPRGQPWLDLSSLRRYRAEHDRYVPTRQALADAIYEAFRGGQEGPRAIRRALFEYWSSGSSARQRSMSLLSCSEGRASVFLTEYLKTARHALEASFVPQHASEFPMRDRMRKARGAARLAKDKLGLVAQVMWAQVRPSWLPRSDSMI